MFQGSSLLPIRLAEVYAWLAVGFLFSALLIGPLYKVIPRLPGKAIAFDARRLVGIGAAWFALLHTTIAYLGLFKGSLNPFNLPGTYQKAFLLGILALLILIAMAVTSFDKAMRVMGAWWYRLHRLVYIAGILILVHALMIGSHAPKTLGLAALGITSLIIMALHTYTTLYATHRQWWRLASLLVAAGALTLTLRYGIAQHREISYIEYKAPGGPL